MNYTINIELLQAIVNYLARQPYGEVFTLIQAIQSLQPVEPTEPAQEQKSE